MTGCNSGYARARLNADYSVCVCVCVCMCVCTRAHVWMVVLFFWMIVTSLTFLPLKLINPVTLHLHGIGLQSKASAAAAKSLQSCPTLCDPIDGSPPGSPVPGILQARTLEWVAISFSNAWKWKVKVKSLSRVRLIATPWTAARQTPPSMGCSRATSSKQDPALPAIQVNGPHQKSSFHKIQRTAAIHHWHQIATAQEIPRANDPIKFFSNSWPTKYGVKQNCFKSLNFQ